MTDEEEPAGPAVICLSCNIFRDVLPRLVSGLPRPIHIRFFDSMLHMDPEKMEQVLVPAILQEEVTHKVLVVYGDCHPGLHTLEKPGSVVKVQGMNCAEIMLGTDLYHQLEHERTFFFFPEWVHRWREIFTSRFGFTSDALLKEFMGDLFTRIVYIDTGGEIPQGTLDEIATAIGLPVRIIRADPAHLEKRISDALSVLGEG